MKFLKSVPQHKRIVLSFIGAILLPCLILSLLAYRGIVNDQALVKQQQQESLRLNALDLATSAQKIVISEEDNFTEWVTNKNLSIKDRFFTSQDIDAYMESHPLLSNIGHLDSFGRVSLYSGGLFFIPNGSHPERQLTMTMSEEAILERGWFLEYEMNDLANAEAYYSDHITLPLVSSADCRMLLGKLRIQKKRGQLDKVLETIELLKTQCAELSIDGELAFLHVVLIESVKIYLATGKNQLALDNLTECALTLTKNNVLIEEAGFQLVTELIVEYLKIFKSGKDTSFRNQIAVIEASIPKPHEILKSSNQFELMRDPSIFVQTGNNTEDKYARIEIGESGHRSLVSMSPQFNNSNWLLIYNEVSVLDTMEELMRVAMSSIEFDGWRIADSEGHVLASSDSTYKGLEVMSAKVDFGASTWNIDLWTFPSSGIALLVGSGRRIYLLIFVIIAILLVFGLVFTLKTLNTEAKIARLKSDFISTVSHELKSPLTSIRHLSDILASDKVKSEDRKQEYYEVIQQQGVRLTGLIDNLLDFSKLEAGKKRYQFETLMPTPYFSHLVELFRRRISDEEFLVNIDIDDSIGTVSIDPAAMSQVVNNILDNAYKYSGESKLMLVSAKQVDDQFMFSVIDYGFGIDKSEIPKIFDRFYRIGDPLTREVKGSGIGLTIVKQIVEAHQGTIHVQSQIGAGSTFTILLPIIKSA